MKVICIDDTIRPNEFEEGPNIKEGCDYTVVNQCIGYDKKWNAGPCYELLETGTHWLYDVDRFIPLSNIDETEMIREKESVC